LQDAAINFADISKRFFNGLGIQVDRGGGGW